MLTIDALRNYGADVDEGLKRCLNNEAFYLKMVEKAVAGLDTGELKTVLADGNLPRAFEVCHAMKGVLANLSLTPVLEPTAQMTELLRSGTACDYTPYVTQIEERLQILRELCNN